MTCETCDTRREVKTIMEKREIIYKCEKCNHRLVTKYLCWPRYFSPCPICRGAMKKMEKIYKEEKIK